jgi:hypothetical protein
MTAAADAAEAAMMAVESALAEPADQTRPPLVMPAEIREELTVILTYMLGPITDATEATKALSAFAGRMNFSISDDPDEDWDDGEGWLACDGDDLEEARRRANTGEVDDCLHHLERALPEGYGVIAERLAHHFRSRP